MKKCNKCGEEKDIGSFARNRTRKDGIGSWCLECCRAESAKRYAEYPDRVRAINQKSDKKNWGRKYEGIKKWAKDNPERWRALQRKSFDKNKDKRLAQDKRWRAANIEHVREMDRYTQSTRKAKKLSATPSWLTEHDIQSIKNMYSVARLRQEETGIAYEVDHIVPLKSKIVCGLHVPWNLQLLTKSENSRKNNKLLENVMAY